VSSTPPPLRGALAVLAGLLALGLAGCGATAVVRSGATLNVALGEYRVTPQDIHAAPGVLTIAVHNVGRLTHDLEIQDGGETIASTAPLAPGQTALLQAALLPGTYQMLSSILSDQALGAYGTITVG
jgi:hypothetical protein